MYLFTRRAVMVAGRSRQSYEWSLDITERVNRMTGLNVSLYSQVFCANVGTTVWTAFAPDLQTLEGAFDKLNVDDGFVEALDKGAALISGDTNDSLHQVIYGELHGGPLTRLVVRAERPLERLMATASDAVVTTNDSRAATRRRCSQRTTRARRG